MSDFVFGYDPRKDDDRVGPLWVGYRETRAEAVFRLRRNGLPFARIGQELGIAPSTASFDSFCHCPHLQHAPVAEMADRRRAVELGIDPDVYAMEEGDRRRARQKERALRKRIDWEQRRAIESPRSLDALVSDEPRRTLGEVLAGPADADPAVFLTGTALTREVLGDMALEDVARMDERTLDRYRQRLLEMGLHPGLVQEKERERLRDPMPHRGRSIPPARTSMASRHRGRNEASALHRDKGKKFNRRKEKYRLRDAA